jgi:hypothetical protein
LRDKAPVVAVADRWQGFGWGVELEEGFWGSGASGIAAAAVCDWRAGDLMAADRNVRVTKTTAGRHTPGGLKNLRQAGDPWLIRPPGSK